MAIPAGQLHQLLVCGSHAWPDPFAIRIRLEELAEVHGQFEIIHSGAAGVDQIAGATGHHLQLPVREFPAHSAVEMIADGPGAVLAFWDGTDPGTLHVINEAVKKGIAVEIHTPAL